MRRCTRTTNGDGLPESSWNLSAESCSTCGWKTSACFDRISINCAVEHPATSRQRDRYSQTESCHWTFCLEHGTCLIPAQQQTLPLHHHYPRHCQHHRHHQLPRRHHRRLEFNPSNPHCQVCRHPWHLRSRVCHPKHLHRLRLPPRRALWHQRCQSYHQSTETQQLSRFLVALLVCEDRRFDSTPTSCIKGGDVGENGHPYQTTQQHSLRSPVALTCHPLMHPSSINFVIVIVLLCSAMNAINIVFYPLINKF